jgi:hypothetical protein
MKALRMIGTVAAMWWVVANISTASSGPSGQAVKVWIGPWDTKAICEQALQGAKEDVPAGMDTPVCYYQVSR